MVGRRTRGGSLVARVVLMEERRVDSRVAVEEEDEVSAKCVSRHTYKPNRLA